MDTDQLAADRLSFSRAEQLLERAAAMDAQERAGGVDVAELRRAALEAGIGAPAFDAALREGVVPTLATAPTPPWVVRLTMIGVPNRVAAWGVYGFFLLVLLASAAGAVADTLGRSSPIQLERSLALVVASFSVFALWSTAKAIRWTDRHGWDRLP
jgi:hypothetical protein